MKLLLYPAVDSDRLKQIAEAAGPMRVINAENLEQAMREIGDVDGFFGKMTPELLAEARSLRWIQSPTASLEHFLFPELIRHPCVLTNMRGLFSDVIADHVLGYVLMFARNLHRYLRRQIGGCWRPVGGEETSDFATGPATVSGVDRAHLHLSDCTLGIVGLGSIGREVAKRSAAFNLRVIGYDPFVHETPTDVRRLFTVDELPEFLGSCDFVVICAPHTPQTERMFQAEQFSQMKSTGYLINIGRGAIVDSESLVAALRSGGIAGAALDVFETEPLPADHPLWDFPNVILTPHVAAASPRIAERHLETLMENVRCFVAGRPLKNVVDKQRWF